VTAPITSARVRELIAAATPDGRSALQLGYELAENAAQIAKALDLWEKVQGGDAEVANSSTTGYGAHSSTTGYGAHSSTTGDRAHSSTTGRGAHSSTTGDGAHSSTTGPGAHSAASGRWAIAAALGIGGTAQAEETGAIVLAHWAFEDGEWKRKAIAAFEVGTNGVEPGKTYRLTADGQPEEVE
jgi:hypothetical protein